MSDQTIRIVIEVDAKGNLQVTGPIAEPITILGILELAKEGVLEMQRANRKKPRVPNIVIPTIGPKRPM